MIRLSASAAFSISPPAFSIMPSIVPILAFSSGYSLSLSSKLGLGREDFSMSEKRPGMGSPSDGLTHIYLCDAQGFVQHLTSREPAKFPRQPLSLTRTFNYTPAPPGDISLAAFRPGVRGRAKQ